MPPGRPRKKKLAPFGVRLRAAIERSEKFGSRAAFLRKMGSDPAQVYRYETGERPVPGDVVVDFAEALGTTASELLGETFVEAEWVDAAGWLELEAAGVVDAIRARGVPEKQIEHVRRTPGWKGGGSAEDYRRLLDDLLVSHVTRAEAAQSVAARERRRGKLDMGDELP